MLARYVLVGLSLVCSTTAILLKRRQDARTMRAIEAHPVMRWSEPSHYDQH